MAADLNDPRFIVPGLRAGDVIDERTMQAIANAINGRRGVSNPPSQVFTVKGGGGGTGSTVVVARVATSNLALTGTISVDGSNAANGTLVLAQGQTTAADRGVWVVNTAGAWTKSSPFQPTLCLATAGTSYTQSAWFLAGTNSYKIVRGALA